jgi:hypothetical protein
VAWRHRLKWRRRRPEENGWRQSAYENIESVSKIIEENQSNSMAWRNNGAKIKRRNSIVKSYRRRRIIEENTKIESWLIRQ